MKQRSVETGALAPLIQSTAMARPGHWRDVVDPGARTGQCETRLTMSSNARENGQFLIAQVREAVARVAVKGNVNRSAMSELRRLVHELWPIVRQTPEFIDYMGWLSKNNLPAANHILEVVPPIGEHARRAGRGRPQERYDRLVVMVDLVRKEEGGSVRKACERLLTELQPSPFRSFGTVRSMENAHSKHHERVHAMEQVCILPEDLARVPYVLRADL